MKLTLERIEGGSREDSRSSWKVILADKANEYPAIVATLHPDHWELPRRPRWRVELRFDLRVIERGRARERVYADTRAEAIDLVEEAIMGKLITVSRDERAR